MPTAAQAIQAVVLCQWLSNGYQSINVFRYEANLKTLYIQAGIDDSITITVATNGDWRFV